MAAPQVPPRPSRSQHANIATDGGVPRVPARPAHHSRDRTQSPNPESFPRSPLNEIPGASNSIYGHGIKNASGSNLSLPQRPPSVSLPSIGQEGNEYGDLEKHVADDAQDDENAVHNEPEQKRKIGDDLPLHQPRPSFSNSSAKARVQAVTRTDSTQAAAAGIGKAPTPFAGDDRDPHARSLKPKVSFSATESPTPTERPGTGHHDDDGIPEVVGGGQRVPMYPNAGDVQAPTPSPHTPTFAPGIGFHNDGSRARQASRNRSRQEFRPPGSYGLHGHGMTSSDSLEKAWYDKHPEKLETEEGGQYGPGIGGTRGEWALSSDDLNKIVRDTKSRSSGFGTANIEGLPNEQIGYMATEEYTSRFATPQAGSYMHKLHSNHSQPTMESPLRKTSFPVDQSISPEMSKGSGAHGVGFEATDDAIESETEDEAIHIDPPMERKSKIHGNGYDPPTEDLGPHGGNTEAQGGWIEETGYGVPILASDEVAKEVGSEFMQPAISPAQSRRGSQFYAGVDSEQPPFYQSGFRSTSLSGSAANSRPTSRPGSLHGAPAGLQRFMSHDDHEGLSTPLEDVDEYEPLFPDEEDQDGKPMSAAQRFKRKEMMKRFPSQDIWEDTPNSLQLQATVETPEPKETQVAAPPKPASSTFETPEQEAARKGEVSEAEKSKLVPKGERLAKSYFQPHLREEMYRPGMKQRFPSRDIWEDSPDSAKLETVIANEMQDASKSTIDEGLVAGAVVQTSGRPDSESMAAKQEREGATAGVPAVKPGIPPRPVRSKVAAPGPETGSMAPPSIPTRPQKRGNQAPPAGVSPIATKVSDEASSSETHSAPTLPDRSKPEIPKRPENPIAKDVTQKPADLPDHASTTSSADITPVLSNESIRSPPLAPKPKPAVPARPQGSKIAALKAGFLSDLDKRLQLGPHAPQKAPSAAAEGEDEKKGDVAAEEEKAPLSDARKGRARGPVRRKPAVSPAAAVEIAEGKGDAAKWSMAKMRTIWEMEPLEGLKVASSSSSQKDAPRDDSIEKVDTNTSIQSDPQIEEAQRQKADTFRNDVSLSTTEAQPLSQVVSKASNPSVVPASSNQDTTDPPPTASEKTQEAELEPSFSQEQQQQSPQTYKLEDDGSMPDQSGTGDSEAKVRVQSKEGSVEITAGGDQSLDAAAGA